uniref:Ig-like domain-containing protein n=1 Tax=Rattus norvegicus TaxID=10116 RepID=A0ABK0L3P8_RAT
MCRGPRANHVCPLIGASVSESPQGFRFLFAASVFICVGDFSSRLFLLSSSCFLWYFPVGLFQSSSTTEPQPSQGSAMLLALLPVLGINFLLRVAQAQSVTQPDAHVTVSEEASLQLRCKYSSSVSPSLFWYVQYPQQGLLLPLKYYSGNPMVQGLNDFKAEFNKSDSSFHLRKASVHWSDSAVYFCALSTQCLSL